jgi:hypothetical protein
MAETITHAFISAKTQSPDTTLVSKNEWNDGHVFTGGTNGQVLLYDNTQPNNMRWTDGQALHVNGTNYSGTSPSTTLSLINFTLTSPAIAMVMFDSICVTSTGALAISNIYADNVDTGYDFGIIGTGVGTFMGILMFNLTAGAHSFHAIATIGGGATFTSLFHRIHLLTFGV